MRSLCSLSSRDLSRCSVLSCSHCARRFSRSSRAALLSPSTGGGGGGGAGGGGGGGGGSSAPGAAASRKSSRASDPEMVYSQSVAAARSRCTRR